jgi:hypothetical protein
MDPDKSPNSAGARRAFLVAMLYEATTRPRPTGATRGIVTERGESDSMCGSPRAENRWFSAPMEHEETREETGQVRYRKGRSSGLLLSNGRKRSPNDSDSNRLVSPSAAHESVAIAAGNKTTYFINTGPAPFSGFPCHRCNGHGLVEYSARPIGGCKHERAFVAKSDEGADGIAYHLSVVAVGIGGGPWARAQVRCATQIISAGRIEGILDSICVRMALCQATLDGLGD